ncbi:putative sulfite oxidase [Rubellimicrobium mesophilum DSM 19309]|uniref:Putative sulfite oxidase n=1 Tax=Rubellimicrobium mesophilum DSM 19309 TaxID=442562 RepID=A0A017HQY4_9RHOB|nr:sulfite oxidase [Rubellimicrobium mesophilum]EYD76533.1 putative sulfite oxidase [Rubellimicrobium mesophilum DSM 19309]
MLDLTRRDLILKGSAAFAAHAIVGASRAGAFPSRPGETVLPWLDQPDENPVPGIIHNQLVWEDLDSWITPNDEFFFITNIDGARPEVDAASWKLEFDGLVDRPLSLSLDDLKARPRQEVTCTIECSGNSGLPFLTGAIGNATWAGTPLAPLLQEAGVQPEAIEVAFWGTDATDVEARDTKMHENYARSMTLADARRPEMLLAYEMNGEALPIDHGFPLRLVAPGWYGSVNVKWLRRIEVMDHRLETQFMARDFVTVREVERDGETFWTETSVRHMRLKSAPARVTRAEDGTRITGAAWGAPIAKVEVRIDDGPWQEARLDPGERAPFAWAIWSHDWPDPSPGEHTITSRATDTAGNLQPAMDDPLIAKKHTFYESNGQITRRVRIG